MAERGFDIGQRLRQLRRDRVLTQEDLEKKSGVHSTTISDLERGAQNASAKTVRRLAKALEVNVQDLTRPYLPGGAKSEEHLDAVLDHEKELRQRHANRDNGEGNGSGGSNT